MQQRSITILCGLILFGFGVPLLDAGPYDPDAWPSVADPSKIVHFVSTDNTFAPLSDSWTSSLMLSSGGDQATAAITVGGQTGVKVVGNYLNTADSGFTEWADDETIDILMQVYGDDGLFNANGQPRNFNFLIGVLPELAAPNGGQILPEAKNRKWNWVLFRIPNNLRPSDGTRFVGSIPANAQGATQFGGVNGGSIRLEGVPNLVARVMAFGERGAFGEPSDYTQFLPPDGCDPEPETNHAFLDLNASTSDHLEVLSGGDQTTAILEKAGPAGAQRRAVQAAGNYMNFGITEEYLGAACNDPRAVKICVEFYDDPALTGSKFGPEAYATDEKGGIGFVPADRRYTLTGSGTWQRIAWTIPAVSLFGVNVAPLTAGPRLFFEGGQPLISRFDLAILRVAPHPLAGRDPLADCFEDPNICTDAYGSYAEMNLATGELNGLAPGSSGGDQEMIQAEAGPDDDRRFAIRPARDDGNPAFAHNYLNLAIVNQVLGPSSQPNAHLAICVTYYDDPALAGQSFRPEVYQSDRNGVTTFAFTPGSVAVTLPGSGRWREAYFELPDTKFSGVNQGPQAAARFFVTGKIFFTRVRYAVIRPCGPMAQVNRLAECQHPTLHATYESVGRKLKLAWTKEVEGWTLESTDALSAPTWSTVAEPAVLEGDEWVVRVPMGNGSRFFRLKN